MPGKTYDDVAVLSCLHGKSVHLYVFKVTELYHWSLYSHGWNETEI